MIDRILYLDGIPKITIHFFNKSDQTPKEQISFLLKMKSKGVSTLLHSNSNMYQNQDSGSRDLIARMVAGTQIRRDWATDQLDLIKMVVPENYLLQCIDDQK